MIRKTFYISWPIVLAFALLWLIVIFILLRGRIFTTPPSTETRWVQITNDLYNFSIKYPDVWKAETYGEGGFRGASHIKLQIFDTMLGNFRIFVSYQSAHTPSIQQAAEWGAERMKIRSELLAQRGNMGAIEVGLWEDSIQGQPVLRRRYGNEQLMFEDVYIARGSDMIIITLQSDTPEFDSYLDDFNRIVASFEPLK